MGLRWWLLVSVLFSAAAFAQLTVQRVPGRLGEQASTWKASPQPQSSWQAKKLVATTATQHCYALVVIGTMARICSALGHGATPLLHAAGLSWSLAFLVFAAAYWQVLTGARFAPKASPAAQRA